MAHHQEENEREEATILNTVSLTQSPVKRFKEDEENSDGWDSLEAGIWQDIIQRVEHIDKVSVVHIGMCSKNLRTIVSTTFAPKMSLESIYEKLPGMSPKLFYSIMKWWEVHSNTDAGIMLGMHLAWYQGNCSKGLETLTKVADKTEDPQAIYMANIVYRSVFCEVTEPPPARLSFTRGGKDNHKLNEYRDKFQKMVNCYVMKRFVSSYRCLDVSIPHIAIWNVPRESLTCPGCFFDAEAMDHRTLTV